MDNLDELDILDTLMNAAIEGDGNAIREMLKVIKDLNKKREDDFIKIIKELENDAT